MRSFSFVACLRRRSCLRLLAYLVLGGAWLAGASAYAALPGVTRAQAVKRAASQQPRVRRALAELAWRQREAAVPRAAWYPQLGAGAQWITGTSNNSTATVLNVPEVDLVRIGGTPMTHDPKWRPAPSTLVALTLDQQIYDFGRIAANAAIADAIREAALADAESARLDAELGAEEAYFAVRTAQEIRRATEDAYSRVTAHRDFVRAGIQKGLRSPIELQRAEAEVAQLDVRRVRAQAGLEAAQAALAAAIGATDPRVDAIPDELETPTTAPTSLVLDDAWRAALARHPALRAAHARTRAQQAATRATLHELLPNVFATATISGRAGGATPSSGEGAYGGGWLPSVPNWHIGLVLQWNVFDAVVVARRSASLAREQVARADEAVLQSALELLVQRAALELTAARRSIDALVAAQRAADANYAQARARFIAGLGTTLEMADAEALLANAQVELAIGRFAVARAEAQLGRALGTAPIEETR